MDDPYNNLSVFHPQARVSSEVRLMGWNIPPDELKHIPDHWLSYPETEVSLHYMLGIIYTFLMFASLIGNGLVIWIFSSAKSLRTPSNMFVVNLAILDFIMLAKTPIFIFNSFRNGTPLTHLQCQIFSILGSISGIGAGMTNAFIANDRYNVITRPMEGKMTTAKAGIMVGFVWIYIIPWTVLPYLEIWGRFVPEGYLTSCTFDYMTDNFDTRLFVGCIFFCSYLVPMTMIIIYYSQIVSHVFAHEKQLREQAKKMNVESLRSNAGQSKETAEIRIAKAAITICFLFVASWTPYGVMALIGAFGDKTLLTPGVTMIPACCCKLVACIDPYVYAISHPRYRMELQKKLPWLAIDEKETSDAASASTATEPTTTTA